MRSNKGNVRQIGRGRTFEHLEDRRMLACDRIDDAAPLAVPALSSLPEADQKIILDFDGDTSGRWGAWAEIGGTDTQGAIPAYDLDGNATCFSQAELSNMLDVFAIVKEKFSVFNLDVTTIDSGSLDDGRVGKIVIGGDGSWYGEGNAGGIAARDGFYNDNESVGYVWGNANDVRYVGETVAHEAAHMLGLKHQSLFNADGTLADEYRDGLIMGDGSLITPGGRWGVGPSTGRESIDGSLDRDSMPQDDIATLLSKGLTLRDDDHGNDRATASDVTVTGTEFYATGVLERESDADYFRLRQIVPGTEFTVRVQSDGIAPMFDPRLELYDDAGTLVKSAESTGVYDEVITIDAAASSTYYAVVRAAGNPSDVYNIGQYSLHVTLGGGDDDAPSTARRLTGIAEDPSVSPLALGQHVVDDSVSTEDPLDWYVMDLPRDATVLVTLTNLSSNANLYVFSNVSGRAERLLFSSEFAGTSSEGGVITSDQLSSSSSNSVFIGVEHFSGSLTGYRLTVTIDDDPYVVTPALLASGQYGWKSYYGSVQGGDIDAIIAAHEWAQRGITYAAEAKLTTFSAPVVFQAGYDRNENGSLEVSEIVETISVPKNTTTRIANYPWLTTVGNPLVFEVVGSTGSPTEYEVAIRANVYRPSVTSNLHELELPIDELSPTRHSASFQDELTRDFPFEVLGLGVVPPGPLTINVAQEGSATATYQLIRDTNGNGVIDQGETVAGGLQITHQVPENNQAAYYFVATLSPQAFTATAPFRLEYHDTLAISSEGTSPANPRKISVTSAGYVHGVVAKASDNSLVRPQEFYIVDVPAPGQLTLDFTMDSQGTSPTSHVTRMNVVVGRDDNQDGLINENEQILSRSSLAGDDIALDVVVDKGSYLLTVEIVQPEAQVVVHDAFDYQLMYQLESRTDTTPVSVTAAELVDLDGVPAIKLQFSDDIGDTVGQGDILVRPLAFPQVQVKPIDEVYLPDKQTLYVVLDPDEAAGSYQLAILAGRIADPVGNALGAAFIFDFMLGSSNVRLPGDANGDGVFNSTDLILAFGAGEYEDGIDRNSNWEEGDWNGDGEFDSTDLIYAFQQGTYELGVSSGADIATATDTIFIQGNTKHGFSPLL